MKVILEVTKRLPDPITKRLMNARLNPLLRPTMDWVASKMKHQDGLIQRGVGKGLGFNPGGSNAGYLLGVIETDVQDLLCQWLRAGMTVYDIGANVGFLSVIVARLVGGSGRVIAFEPVPSLAQQTARNAQLNGFEHLSIYPVALSDTDGEAIFQVSQNLTMGKLASPKSSGGSATDLVVRSNRLDTVIREQCLPYPDLVKVDVEGAEAAVLDGAIEVLQRARPLLLIELHSTNAAVADRLDRFAYVARPLGNPQAIRDCPPNSCIAAVPAERQSMLPKSL